MALKIGRKRKVFEGKYITVWAKTFFDKKGKRGVWEYIERKKVIFVFPITKEQKAVLVKNFRVTLERYVIEVPAGLKDKEGESDEETARRELLEETGYQAEKFIPVREWPYRQGSCSGIVAGFIAVGLKKVTDKVGDDSEDLEVVEVSLKDLQQFYEQLPKDVLLDSEILAMAQLVQWKKIRG